MTSPEPLETFGTSVILHSVINTCENIAINQVGEGHMLQKNIAFLGAGSMAEAMIAAIVNSNHISPKQIFVTNKTNKERLNRIESKLGVRTVSLTDMPFNEIDFFILAMKPNGADESLSFLKHVLHTDQVVISVLAGISTAFMEERMNPGQQVIRVMPNTSSMIQESATAMSLGSYCSNSNAAFAKQLLSCMGKVYLIDEQQMDVFTGMAGSGPAYFYYLVEQMEKVGEQFGMDLETSRNIAAQTLYGAAKMIMENDESPAELREKVTSPNGTTAAGLDALMKYHGGEAMEQAVTLAAKRSKKISKELNRELIPS